MGGLRGGLSQCAGPSQLDSWPLLLLEVQPNPPPSFFRLSLDHPFGPLWWEHTMVLTKTPGRRVVLISTGSQPKGCGQEGSDPDFKHKYLLSCLPQTSHSFASHTCSPPCSLKSSMAIWHLATQGDRWGCRTEAGREPVHSFALVSMRTRMCLTGKAFFSNLISQGDSSPP